jgi:hypothetical protein
LTPTRALAGDPVGGPSPPLFLGTKLTASRLGCFPKYGKINDMDVYFLLA